MSSKSSFELLGDAMIARAEGERELARAMAASLKTLFAKLLPHGKNHSLTAK